MALPSIAGRSIGSYALTRAKLLAEFYDVSVISDSFPDTLPVDVQCMQITPRNFNYLRRFCHVPNELAFAYAVRYELKRLQGRKPIDFILCHGYTLTRFVGRYLYRLYDVRYGMFMHGHIFTRPRGTYDWRLTVFYRWMAPACYKEAHLVFALSPDQKKLAIKAGATAHQVILAPNGIENGDIGICGESIDVARKIGGEPNGIRILYVGRFSAEKGVDTLIAACGLLAKWKVDYSLTLVGGGARSKELSDLAERTGIADRVEFVSSVPREQLGAFYRATDILCVPSLDEPFGNVVLEGLISGCLVVGSELGGIRFIISDGIDGYLVPAAEPRKWAEKLKFISDNKGDLNSLLENGREMVSRRFDWENIVLDMHKSISRTLA